ncbi:TetR/AcrR family transcriptional regulator [Aminobacter sp. P9b]|uniref:AcrR family transcriptional regulator n=1 Tax=Aminobacter niigataensis TaxID=83265 RepID=A0ABR6L556_9HYPH|nr:MULTISPECIES: TetR/AcrR family transcriptional regulator [Aminobacter]AWC25040.1 HTH-type transcriptional regulator RutR [Aminobacter sp. MSH1]MBB4651933.1 AcrR family transcriptional regulator [Aminobacter niigataensis]
MSGHRPSSRDKILAAAAELADIVGPGNLSLDAVAQRAGVSKGGLLYNFPTKAKLMQALVQDYLKTFEDALSAKSTGDEANSLAAYIELSAQECSQKQPSAAGVLAALAEDPDFLNPVRDFKRHLLDRLKAENPDTAKLIVAFLVIEGLRSMKLFDMDILHEDERNVAIAYLLDQAAAQ